MSCVVSILFIYRRFCMAKKMGEATRCRVRARRMLLAGKGPTEVTRKVGVARQTVHTWKGVLDEGGIDALRAIGSKGRPAQLDGKQLETLRRSLLDRPTTALVPSSGRSSGYGCSSSACLVCHTARCMSGAGLELAALLLIHPDAQWFAGNVQFSAGFCQYSGLAL